MPGQTAERAEDQVAQPGKAQHFHPFDIAAFQPLQNLFSVSNETCSAPGYHLFAGGGLFAACSRIHVDFRRPPGK
ncbi:MAG: hypothetical protein ACLSAP_00290 [Oscillospiraceae bacterium]